MNKDQILILIEKCKKGDKSAFKNIVVEYSEYVFILAFRILCNEEDAKDIVQETFIRVWNNIEKYKYEIKITTWIYKITTNLCVDKLRTAKRKPMMYRIDNEHALNTFADENFSNQHDNQKLGEIINKLTEELGAKQKLVFVLRDLEGLENDEIEQITGMDKVQIKSNLYYARQQIKNSLIQNGYEVR